MARPWQASAVTPPPTAARSRAGSSWRRLTLLWLLACGACKHDLDKLRAPHAETGGQAAPNQPEVAGSDTPLVDRLASCRPCRPPTGLSELVLPAACCTGVNDSQCGVAFGASDCFARHAPGLPDTSCPDATTRSGLKFAGCCRFDEQCGVSLDELELGCLPRDSVPPALGGPLVPVACVPKCDSDQACRPLTDLARCVEDATHRKESRVCAFSCSTDKDCAALPGTVCAIQQNKTELRVDAVCRKPFGTGLLGDACSTTNDCAHGVCLQAGSAYCSELCRTDLECRATGSQCKTSMIPLPAPASGTQAFNVCVAK
jgi:hypothetical protein